MWENAKCEAMTLSQKIGRRIKLARDRSGLTQEQLGKELGVSDGAISSYELGDTLPSIKNAIALAKIFGVSLDWLFTGAEMGNNEPPNDPGMTEEEIKLLIAFRQAPVTNRKVVLKLLVSAVRKPKATIKR